MATERKAIKSAIIYALFDLHYEQVRCIEYAIEETGCTKLEAYDVFVRTCDTLTYGK